MMALGDAKSETNTTMQSSATNQSGAAEARRGIPKVSSGINISAIYVEQNEGQII